MLRPNRANRVEINVASGPTPCLQEIPYYHVGESWSRHFCPPLSYAQRTALRKKDGALL